MSIDIINENIIEYTQNIYKNLFINDKVISSLKTISMKNATNIIDSNFNIKKGVLNRIEECNDSIIELKNAYRIVEDCLDFLDDFKWTQSLMQSTSDYVFTTNIDNTFASVYLKSIARKKDNNHFFFLNKYTQPIEKQITNSLNENILSEESSTINFLDDFHLNTFYLTSNFLSKSDVNENNFEKLTTSSFIGQNLVNLSYCDTFLYPNTAESSSYSNLIAQQNIAGLTNYCLFSNKDLISEASIETGNRISSSFINERVNSNLLENTKFYLAKNKGLDFAVLTDGLDNSLYLEKNSLKRFEGNTSQSINYNSTQKELFRNEIYSDEIVIDISRFRFGQLPKLISKTYYDGQYSTSYQDKRHIDNRTIRYSTPQRDYVNKGFAVNQENSSREEIEFESIRNEKSYANFSYVNENIDDSMFAAVNSFSPIDDNCFWSNRQTIFDKITFLFECVRESPVDKFIYEKNYDIKSRYKKYFEDYRNIFRNNISSSSVDENITNFQFISIRSSSENVDFLKSYHSNNSDSILVKESLSKSYHENIDKIKLSCNFISKEYKNLLMKDNVVFNIKKDFSENYVTKLKQSSENYFSSIVGLQDGIINKDSAEIDIIAKKDNELFYLSNDSKENSINEIRSTSERIANEIDINIPSKDDIDDIKKKLLANNFLKNTKEINNQVARDISTLFDTFGDLFKSDYQVGAFDKIISSYYASCKFEDTTQIKDLTKLIIAASIVSKSKKIKIGFLEKNTKDKKTDVENLERILPFKEVFASVFSSKNISMQENYFFETNTKSYFNKLNLNITLADRENLGGYRNTNSLALCFPYNTLNIFSTSKNLDNTEDIFDYYDYGMNYLGRSFDETRRAISGSIPVNNRERIVITFPLSIGGDYRIEQNKSLMPKPIAFRKINTIDSYKNTISTIEHIQDDKDNCETVIMHYIWDKKFDYKNVNLMSGEKTNTLEEFIKVFSKKDCIADYTSKYKNLIETSSYPIHEMFYINRKIENRIFSNINSSKSISLLGAISDKISEIVRIMKIDISGVENLSDAYELIGDMGELNNIAKELIKVYSFYYEKFYKRFFERYFSCIQEIPYVKQNIFDSYSEISTDDYTRFISSKDIKHSDAIYHATNHDLVKRDDNKGYTVKASSTTVTINLNDYIENYKDYFYTEKCNGYFDTIISINDSVDKDYMFQEYASLFLYPNNAVAPYSKEKLSLFEHAENKIFDAIDAVSETISNESNRVLSYSDQNKMIEIDSNEEYGLVNVYKDVNNTLVRNDISYGFSIDILLNYILFLKKEEERKVSAFNKVSNDLSVITELKNKIDTEDIEFKNAIMNSKYFNKLIQNLNYCKYNANEIELAFKQSESLGDTRLIRNLDISKNEINSIVRKKNYCVSYLQELTRKTQNINFDMLFIDIEKYSYDNMLVKITVSLEGTDAQFEYYYMNNALHYEFKDERETYGRICLIDNNEYTFENKLKYIEEQELSSYIPYSENIDSNEVASLLYKTMTGSNFCKAFLDINSINSDCTKDYFSHVSLNTVGLFEEIGEENKNIIFDLKENLDFGEELSDEVYENINPDLAANNMSVIREYASILSDYNSNYILQKSLSYDNIEKYLIIPLIDNRQDNNIKVYGVKVEVLLW